VTSDVIELGILGPLEVRLAGESLTPGGAKQRAVLAALLLRDEELVSVERLVDEVWGDDPPPSAAHTLESYVSRLRQLFNGHGPTLVRRGAGYSLELHGATLDSRTFVALYESATLAAAAGEPESVVQHASAALAVWRGPALADVALASAGRAEAERLEELRLRTYELRFEADLALGRHEQVVSELQTLVGQSPYRERFVAQLMLALYRSGRHAEALEAYERTRTALAHDLGLRPSEELQQLSGQIVRQESQLRQPESTPRDVHRRHAQRPSQPRRVAALVLAGAATAVVMAFTATGSASSSQASPAVATPAETGARVALVVPSDSRYPQLVPWDTGSGFFRTSVARWGFETKVLMGSDAGLRRGVEEGGFDLVLVVGRAPAQALRQSVREMPEMKFAFLDSSLADLSLAGVSNASAIRFADEQTSELQGYVSALVPRRGGSPKDRVDKVSVVAGPDSAHARRVVAGFRRGVARVRGRSVAVRVDYVGGSNLTACERTANDQIDAGSDVVFVDAGHCGLGALAVARLRGVWGIGSYDDGVNLSPHILAVTYKDYAHAIDIVLEDFALGGFRAGEDHTLGLNDNYAVGVEDVDRNKAVPDSIWSKVASLCSRIRAHSQGDAP
jgi:DNA-binding SARP family transcriptional activator/basic membrane lipoprotein Med (substrate-binding protein (PBP1-ABC) superfamily)